MLKWIVFLGLFPVLLMAQNEPEKHQIKFFEGSWQEALEAAKKSDKLIFVDAYTTWCGPCKKMEKEIFTDKKVADYYNYKFINVRMDMERGEGLAFAQKYLVRVYPNFLFIDADGVVMHRRAGSMDAASFVGLGSLALNPQYRLAGMREQYEEGERALDFLTALIKMSYDAYDNSHKPIVEEYLRLQKDWETPQHRQFVMDYLDNIDSPAYDYLVENKEAFIEQFGELNVNQKIRTIILGSASSTNDLSMIERLEQELVRAFPKGGQKVADRYKKDYFRKAKDGEAFAKSAIAYYDLYMQEASPTDLNNDAWYFYELVDNPKQLKKAIQWTEQSIDMDPKYYNYDTLAFLLAKVGKKRKAIKTAEKAIELAKAENEDYRATEALLQELNQ